MVFNATIVMIGTDCIGSYKSNYHTITMSTAPISSLQTSLCLLVEMKILYLLDLHCKLLK